MYKRLSLIGAFCIALMALWVSGAHALNLSGSSIIKCPYPKRYVNGVCQSPILVDLSWGGIGNADKTVTDFTVKLTPITPVHPAYDPAYPTRILFRNPGGNTGGTSSVNFDDSTTPIIGGSSLNPFITGKGKANTQTIFGDCDQCDALDVKLPDDGKLWFLFQDSRCVLSDQPTREDYIITIDCIKMNLVEDFKPNTSWWPYAVEIDNLNLEIKAYTDGVLKLTGDFQSCKINSEYQYICDLEIITKSP